MNRWMMVFGLISLMAVNVAAQREILPLDAADMQQRRELAQRILASKERPGRELDPAFKAIMMARLQRDPVDTLKEKLDTGFIGANALGDSASDLTYTAFQQPCRIIDTRGAGGGALLNGVPRTFYVSGTTGFPGQGGVAGGCNVPAGASTAVMINFVAVNPGGAGNLRASAFPNPIPATGSIINYAALTPNLNVANGIIMPVCDSTVSTCTDADMRIQANGGSTQLVADVLGYFTAFPRDSIRSFSMSTRLGTSTTIGTGCTSYGSLIVTAPVAGTAVLRSDVTVDVDHTNGTEDTSIVSLNLDPNTCQDQTSYGESQLVHVPASAPSGLNRVNVTTTRSFAVTTGPNVLYLNGNRTAGSADQVFFAAGIEATFLPD